MKKLSIIIPVYNEQSHLLDFLEKINELKFNIEHEFVIIDDCSKDDSAKIVNEFSFKTPVQIFQQEVNQGKGAAIQRGIREASGDIIGVLDADFEYDMNEICEVIEPILQGKSDVVFGSRFKKNGIQVHKTYHYLINRFLTLLSNFMSGLYLTDMETCYKYFRADVIKNIELESNRFGFEPEITAKIARLRLRVAEVPISYYPRNYEEGKKITWKDGVAAIRHIFFFNFRTKPKDYIQSSMPKQFVLKKAEWL